MATIGIVHAALEGHLGPARRLAAVLEARGHRIVPWAPAPAPRTAQASPRVARAAAAGATEDFRAGATAQAAFAAAKAQDVLDRLGDEGVEVVVHDFTMVAGRVAGRRLGVPTVCSYPLAPQALAYGHERRPPPPGVAELLDVSRQVVRRRWGVDIGGFEDVMVNPGDVGLLYTTPEIAGARPPDDSWRMIGPLLGDGPLAEPGSHEPPLVYMALGTIYSDRAPVFRAALEALAAEDVRVLVGTGGRLDPRRLEPVPDNATVELRPEGRAALAGAAVHITHGGASSFHESLHAGVPMVCLPQGSDQRAWGWRTDVLGVGELVEQQTPQAIRAAVLRLLDDDAPRRRARELGAHLRAYRGEEIAGEAVERLLR